MNNIYKDYARDLQGNRIGDREMEKLVLRN